jgi:hypothetical protein
MKRFRGIATAALLAGMAILSAAPARADLMLTITQDANGSATESINTTTGVITAGPTFTGSTSGASFASTINPVTHTATLSFTGTVGNIFFDLSVAATTNTPGTATLASLNLSSNNISNLLGSATSVFSIATSATGYTMPAGTVTGDVSNSGTLTNGSITGGSFTGSAGAYMPAALTFAATGTAVSLANNPPATITSVTSPYTMAATLAGTLGASSTTASLGGTVTITPVPEPSTVAAAFTGICLVGLASLRRKVRNRA